MKRSTIPAVLTGAWLAAVGSGETITEGHLDTVPGSCCPLCGHAFRPGEKGHTNPSNGSVTFNDAPSMKGGCTDPVCDACIIIWGKRFLLNLSKTIATLQGMWSVASNNDRAHFLLNPPEPPFVFVVGLAKQQHLFWRTPVATSRDVFPIRVGPHAGFVRRKTIESAWRLTPDLLQLVADYETDGPAKRTAPAKPSKAASTAQPHPFIRLDRDLVHPQHGILKPNVRSFLSSPGAPPQMRVFDQLTALECWGLAAIYNASAISDTQPPPIATPAPATALAA